MKLKLWHVDFAGAVIISALMAAAYYIDPPRSPDNAIKPITTRTLDDMRQLCIDGKNPEEWICPGQTRVMQIPVKPGANL